MTITFNFIYMYMYIIFRSLESCRRLGYFFYKDLSLPSKTWIYLPDSSISTRSFPSDFLVGVLIIFVLLH